MNFIEELKWRGMFSQMTPEADEHLAGGMRTGYIGFDPTAPAITIGNYVQIMILTLFQRSGHKPVILMGGATGRVGDPSGKDKERELKTVEELDANLAAQQKEMMKFLEFGEKGNGAIVRNNIDFYKNMNVLDFLRDVGKTLTINYMMSKDSVKNRMDTGMSFTEFSYQLLQAYDFQCLYKENNCTVQMGGSDQWGNITSGTEFIRRNLGEKAHAITSNLLTKSDGKKFGKSEEGNIWIDAELTSPYKFYQFWLNSTDSDLPKLIRYFTLKTREEVEALEVEHDNNPQALKRILGEELTVRIHSREVYEAVLKVSDLLFNAKASRETLMSLGIRDLATVAGEIPSFAISKDQVVNGIHIVDLLAETTSIVASKGEARRAVQGQAVSVNKEKVQNPETVVTSEALLHGKYMMVENGKKNKFMLVAE
ncbi:MAG: tyrosine--tRNA ligase [Lewinellaceae bacterium]|nr:tyrosine--tRNA ligase [Saprospiraceae bacterium]MCB9339165.1 tyrosine--tRNA ligase [Lewinellaceae bacterium]